MVQNAQPQTKLLLLCGLPASGKSSLASQLTSIASTSCQTISLDSFQLDLMSKNFQPLDAWHEAKKKALTATRQLLQSTQSGLIIIDDCFEYKSMRKPYYQLARELSTGYMELHLSISVEQAVKNNSQRESNGLVTEETIRKVAARMEPSGFGQEYQMSVTNKQLFAKGYIDMAQLEELYDQVMTGSVVPIALEEEGVAMGESEMHKLDIELRAECGKVMKERTGLRKRGKEVSELKRQILKEAGESKDHQSYEEWKDFHINKFRQIIDDMK